VNHSSDVDDQEEPAEVTQPLTDADMPDLDDMDETGDYAVFLSPQVSDQLRTRALRQLFRMPGLAVRDGLDDYDDDFTQLPKLGNIVTHEMRRMLARETAREDNSLPVDSAGSDPEEMPEIQQADITPEDNDNPQGKV